MFLKLSRLLATFVITLTMARCDDQWKKYEFFFHENGGSEVAGFWIREEDFVLEDMPVSTRPGYAFGGWFLDDELTIALSAASLEEKGGYRVDLYAKWLPADVDVTVEHWHEDLEGEYSLFESEIIGGITGTPVSAEPHLYFGYTENTTHPNRISSGTPEEGVPLVLRFYYSLVYYYVTFIPNNGGEEFGSSYRYGEIIVLPNDLTRESYTFGGWYLNYTFTQGPVTDGYTMPLMDLTLWAKWIPITVTITFVTNGGTAITPITGPAFSPWATMPETNREGYVFDGWYTDLAFTDIYVLGDTLPGQDMTLYAKWKRKAVTVTFVTNGSDPIDAINGYAGDLFELPVPTWSDHTFDGWYLDEGLTTRYDGAETLPNDAITLFANWFGQTYMINFDTMGGPYIMPQYVPAGAPLDLPTPTREGFVFAGWYDASLTVPFTDTVMPAQYLMLYAKWTPVG